MDKVRQFKFIEQKIRDLNAQKAKAKKMLLMVNSDKKRRDRAEAVWQKLVQYQKAQTQKNDVSSVKRAVQAAKNRLESLENVYTVSLFEYNTMCSDISESVKQICEIVDGFCENLKRSIS